MHLHFRPPKPRAPDELGGVKIPYARLTGKGHKLAWYAILVAVLSPIVLLLSGVVGSWLTLTANGSVFLEQDEIRATHAGRIEELRIAVGQPVAAGQTLAVLDSIELDAAAARNDLERETAAATRRSAAAQQQSAAEELRAREKLVRYWRDRTATIGELLGEGAATVAELNAAESATTEAEVGMLQTRAAAERSAAASTADLDHDLLARQQRAMSLAAPYAGRVLELLAKPGEYVTPGEPVLLLARVDNPRVVAYASPKFGTRLRVGMQATIRFPDGTRTLAFVAEPPRLTQRMPADLVDQFGLRPMTVVLNLLPREQLSDSESVQGLPVSVRFHYDFESSPVGHALGTLLGDLSR
ncbi:MAG TPA: HlyD family efflux transporter periplasmic adaptor subunit [Steroidobacteraceae bacterium]|nr:HlyD family efflux transporter periplasmic adaptor subunit [Steroidobacteraceae bacterium]